MSLIQFKKILIYISTLYFLFLPFGYSKLLPIEFRIPLEGQEPEPGTPWPKPQFLSQSARQFTIDPRRLTLTSNYDIPDCKLIQDALNRYKSIILIDKRFKPQDHLTVIENINIYIANENETCGYPHQNMSEEYWIEVPHPDHEHQAWITAHTVWGALRGLETITQLIFPDDQFHLLVNETKVHDFPRYNYRGVLLDTARHYLPKRTILANLDAMAMNKFNVFHWHIVDDQSFPFVLKRFPNISEHGAYSSRHIYTTDDIQEVIEYARQRGIRVIPELDTPGHTHAMARAFPNLLTPCFGDGKHAHTPKYPLYSESEVLNPMLNDTFQFMRQLFDEFRQTFHDDYIHLGMDEVSYDCWKSNPHVTRFMRANNWNDYHQLEEYYVERTIRNVKDVGFKYLMYQDPVDNGVRLANDSIVMVWKDFSLDPSMDHWQNYIKNVAKNGYQMILSACWYLNYINYPYPNMDWEKYYGCDPRDFIGTKAEKDLVIGGEACMWGEFVDATNLLSRLWPRASAVAERLWSNADQTRDVNTARLRLDQHRCRMLRRGIPAAPILNGFCGDYEWDMDDKQITNGKEPLKGWIPSLMKLFR